MSIFSHRRTLHIFPCHSAILSHITGEKRNTANFYEDIFYIQLINKDSSDAQRAKTDSFSKKIAEKQQIIRVRIKFYDSTGGMFFKEKIA